MKVIQYYRASSIEDAYQKLQEDSKNALIAGGLWIKKLGQNYNTLVDISTLGLNQISEDKNEVIVGSMVTLRQLETSPIFNKLGGGKISFAISEIMGVNFRNIATIGGSIFGRYPFSDVITSLLPYVVTLEFFPNKTMSLNEYLQIKGKMNGILTQIRIKKDNSVGFYKKVKLTALDFPVVNIAISKTNNKYSIAVGARPMVAQLSTKAMEYINKIKTPTESDFDKAGQLASEELIFLSDIRASEEYRRDLTKVYVSRGLKEVNK